MARSTQVTKMRKRSRSKKWGTNAKKRPRYPENYVGNITRVFGNDFGFPDKLRTRLRYCDQFQLGTGVTNWVYRFNSLYDPDLSGTGHQPRYFDQLCAANGIYSKYRVLGAKAKITFSEFTPSVPTTVNVGPVLAYAETSNSSSLAYGTASDVMEGSGAKYTVLQDKAGGNNVKTLTQTFSVERDCGVNATDDTVSALYNNNPGNSVFLHFGKIDLGAQASIVNVFVEIEYYAEFYQRNEIAGS